MKNSRSGFTLIELVVVALIMGIMAAMAIPMYLKTVETTKAGDAVSIGHMLASSYRLYLVDNPALPLSGPLNNKCNSQACGTASTRPPCKLVACSYVAKQDWDKSSYTFEIGGGAAGVLATIKRRYGTVSPATTNKAFINWGYTFNDMASGGSGCTALTTDTPPCPNF